MKQTRDQRVPTAIQKLSNDVLQSSFTWADDPLKHIDFIGDSL
jgi:hypothetical protein